MHGTPIGPPFDRVSALQLATAFAQLGGPVHGFPGGD